MTRKIATLGLVASLVLVLGGGLVLTGLVVLTIRHPARGGATIFTVELAEPAPLAGEQLEEIRSRLAVLAGREGATARAFGFANPVVTLVDPGAGRFRLEVPEVGDGAQRIAEDLEALGTRLELRLVDEEVPSPEDGGSGGEGVTCDERGECFRLAVAPLMTNEDVRSAEVIADSFGFPALLVRLTDIAGERMARATGDHLGGRVAILVDGRIVSAPMIQSRISTDLMVNGLESNRGPARLAAVLATAGRLPPVRIVAQEPGSPSVWLGRLRLLLAVVGVAVAGLLAATVYFAMRWVRASTARG
jgi:preprotein translocase subunit SecD